MTSSPAVTSTVYITSTPDRVWQGLTDPSLTRQWYFDTTVDSSWAPGSSITYMRGGAPLFDGAILEIEVPTRLVTTFHPLFHAQARQQPPCRVTWCITPVGEGDLRLAVTFDQFDEDSFIATLVKDGLAYPLTVLKSLIEIGRRPAVGNVTFDCTDPARLAQFWRALTGYTMDGMGPDWAAMHDPRGIGPRLLFMQVPEPKTVKNRVHLDIRVIDREAEADRLVTLGATRLRTMDKGQSWIVMADPEGNEFCIA